MKKENDEKKPSIWVAEGSPDEARDATENNTHNKAGRLKKPLIFGLMGVIFFGCMYLIFAPDAEDEKEEETGLNEAVPQATGDGLEDDKQKAYEREMLDRKKEEKREALMSLSDYWNSETEQEPTGEFPAGNEEESSGYGGGPDRTDHSAIASYRNAQNTLGNFYQEDNSENEELRKELEELKAQLAEKETPSTNKVEDQLALMEKSYQMAAKYLPGNAGDSNPANKEEPQEPTASTTEKRAFVALAATRESLVSALYREPTDSAFMAGWREERNRRFYTAGSRDQVVQPKNSIRACVQQTQKITGESDVRLRLLEPAGTPRYTIPEGTLLTARARFRGGRLQLGVTSIELDGNIIPVDITIYDLDGQQGLRVPYSPEMNALTEMAGNMSQTSGTSLMMTRSAGQQMAADLSRGLVQGVSGYFSKKVKTPKVTLKAGHRVFLVSKK